MTGSELRAGLQSLGLSQRAFARLLTAHAAGGTACSPNTVCRWCGSSLPVPGAVAALVTLMLQVRQMDVGSRRL